MHKRDIHLRRIEYNKQLRRVKTMARMAANQNGNAAQMAYDLGSLYREIDEFRVKYQQRDIRIPLERKRKMDEYTGHLLKHEGDIKDLQHSHANHVSNPDAHGHADRLQAVENKLVRIPDELLDILSSLPSEALSNLTRLLEDFADGAYDDSSNATKGKQNSTAK